MVRHVCVRWHTAFHQQRNRRRTEKFIQDELKLFALKDLLLPGCNLH